MNAMHILPQIKDPRGNLSFIQSGPGGACPFEIESVAWCYDIPGGNNAVLTASVPRRRLIAALSGSFSLEGDMLNRPDRAVMLNSCNSVDINCFATNSVALVLGSYAEGAHVAPDTESADFIDPHPASDVGEAHIIDLPRVAIDGGGSVTQVVNGDPATPFDVRRIFYLFDVPADAARGGHSHYQAREMIVAMSGSFDVVLDDGKRPPRRFTLNRPYHALYVPCGLWRTLDNFSGGAVSAVLTSHRFAEEDYVRDYDKFISLCR